MWQPIYEIYIEIYRNVFCFALQIVKVSITKLNQMNAHGNKFYKCDKFDELFLCATLYETESFQLNKV